MGKHALKRFYIYLLFVSLTVLAIFLSIQCYQWMWKVNFRPQETTYIYIDGKKDFADLCRQLQDAGCLRIHDFKRCAGLLGYRSLMHTGRYAVQDGMSNKDLLENLQQGKQAVVQLTFNNIRSLEDLTERLDNQLMFSADELMQRLTDSLCCQSLGFQPETVKSMFIPNTYEVYWNITPDHFLRRMKREYDAFWTEERQRKAEAIGLTPVEVAILAAIVEEETIIADEYPHIAGLYMNRLRRGMLLQADPTVKYAVGDFTLRRILFSHLRIDSPYNTYIYSGLPPGPIRIPSIQGIEGVLNRTEHKYLYMVAKDDFSGRHHFSATLAEHNRNAIRYRVQLNKRRIR